jgi:hypothetical protein
MFMRTERGSVTLEAFLLLVILTVFFKGATGVNRRLGERYDAILRHRNAEIARLRKEGAAKPLLPSLFPVSRDRGNPRGLGKGRGK